jgi:hypothetical protein
MEKGNGGKLGEKGKLIAMMYNIQMRAATQQLASLSKREQDGSKQGNGNGDVYGGTMQII